MQEAIVLDSINRVIMDGVTYHVTDHNANGTVIAVAPCFPNAPIAVFVPAVINRRHTLRPVVGQFTARDGEDGKGMIFPQTELHDYTLEGWRRAVRAVRRLEWHHLLKSLVTFPDAVKATLVNWSLDDLAKIAERGWMVGFSATAPLTRLYMLIPQPVWDSDPDDEKMPVFDGQVHQVHRLGPILARGMVCTWR